jgi:hypothetical protein
MSEDKGNMMREIRCFRTVRRAAVAVACMATVFMSGCRTMQSEVYQDPSVDFSQLRTFSWVSQRTATAGDSRLNPEFIDARVPVMVSAQLASCGIVEEVGKTPGFLLDYRVSLESKERVAVEGDQDEETQLVGWRRKGVADWEMTDPAGAYVRFYEEGSLLLVARDPQSQKMLWQGVARVEVEAGMSPAQKEALLKRVVSVLLKTFPSGQAGE